MISTFCGSDITSFRVFDDDNNFAICFYKIILESAFAIFLLFFGFLRLFHLFHFHTQHRFRLTRLLIAKYILTFVLFSFQVVNLVRNLTNSNFFTNYHYFIDIVNVIVFLLIGLLFCIEFRKGKHQSFPLRLFLIFHFIMGGFFLKLLIDNNALYGPSDSHITLILYSIEFCSLAGLMFLTLYFNRKPIRQDQPHQKIVIEMVDKKKEGNEEEIEGGSLDEIREYNNKVLAEHLTRHQRFQAHEDDLSLEEKTSWIKRIFFLWIKPLLKTGYRHPLEEGDLNLLKKSERIEVLSKRFRKNWLQQLQRKTPSIIKALRELIGKPFLFAGVLKIFHDVLQFFGPLLLEQIVKYLGDEDSSLNMGLLLAVSILIAPMLQSIIIQNYFMIVFRMGVRAKCALITAIYEKSFKLTNAARQESTTGQIVNLQALDAEKLLSVLPYLHILWSGPFQIIISVFLLVRLVGWSAMVGVSIFVIVIPLNARLMKTVSKIQNQLMQAKDERGKLLNEVLEGIRIVKFFAWESFFMGKIEKKRKVEETKMKKNVLVFAIASFFWGGVPIVIAATTFITYVSMGNTLTAAVAFPAIALFNILRFPLIMLPNVFINMTDSLISLKRIQKFLLQEEIPDNSTKRIIPQDSNLPYAVNIENNATFRWSDPIPLEEPEKTKVKDKIKKKSTSDDPSPDKKKKKTTEHSNVPPDETKKKNTLANLNIEIERGKLYAIIGEVGCGKSSFLQAILGDIPKLSGDVTINGTVGYVGQQAWIQNATIIENITFGLPFVPDKYYAIRDCCQLTADIQILPDGELTEIGERGINLSGGQKQRIALARALYSDRDIYILDDPLSAVDSNVGKKIFEYALKRLLKGKTTILVTHQLQYLSQVDQVIVLHNGMIREVGTYAGLMDSGLDFAALINDHVKTNDVFDETKTLEQLENKTIPDKLLKSVGNLISKEVKQTGKISKQVYKEYIGALGGVFIVGLILFLYLSEQVSRAGTNFWISYWSDNSSSAHSDNYFINIYIILGVATLILIFLHDLLRSLSGLRCATTLHSRMLRSVFRAKASFFDTTPLGRILNRFTMDQMLVDLTIPRTMGMFLNTTFSLLAIFIVLFVVFPLFIVFFIPVTYVYIYVRNYYLSSSRELNRLYSMLKSPIYAQFSETLNGLTTIRAYDAQQRFSRLNEHFIDMSQRAYIDNQVCNKWLANFLEFLGSWTLFSIALLSVLSRANPGYAGITLSYALQVTSTLNWMIRMSSEVESSLVAVERISEYSKLKSEGKNNENFEIDNNTQEGNHNDTLIWPTAGTIECKNVSMRYRSHLDLVLKNVSFNIKGGEKVGVCGRTGSGKSTIMLGLFRLVEPEADSLILIDGVNILEMDIYQLRSCLAIIPQEPTLFFGTIRSNLDPLNHFEDKDLWEALRACHMDKVIENLKGKLDAQVEIGGENLSVGQRQLLCLGRALLKNAKILVMDEATAAVDFDTDKLVQETIRTEFKHSTVLTIAHRLNTLMDYDRVLVLDNGVIIENDNPQTLLRDYPDGAFSQMVKEQAIVNK